jgi:flavin-dependent dehydrogenase
MPGWDAIVIGGGPAGSSCAREMVRSGLRVLVIDRAVFPRDKVCAGWITPQVVETLALDLADYGQGRTCQPITAFSTGVLGGTQVTTSYERPVSYGILRREFDWYLLERSGARLEPGVGLTTLRRSGSEWVINETERAPLLIGAGGHFCPVARHLSARLRPDAPVVAAQEIEFPVAPDEERAYPIRPDTPELFFWSDLQGYAWCFRKGRYLNIGVGRIGKHGFRNYVREFVEFLWRTGRAPRSLPTRWPGHAYLLYADARPLVADGVMLAGDAAGLAYPQSGEGIRTAIESGILAGRAAADLPAYDTGTLGAYRSAIRERFGKPAPSSALQSWMPPAALAAIGARLMATGWFSRHVLLDRWFLHASHAALAATPSSR